MPSPELGSDMRQARVIVERPATVPARSAHAFLAHPTRFERVTFAFRALLLAQPAPQRCRGPGPQWFAVQDYSCAAGIVCSRANAQGMQEAPAFRKRCLLRSFVKHSSIVRYCKDRKRRAA